MKKLILLICMLAGMSSCYHEDALIVPEQPDKYNIFPVYPIFRSSRQIRHSILYTSFIRNIRL